MSVRFRLVNMFESSGEEAGCRPSARSRARGAAARRGSASRNDVGACPSTIGASSVAVLAGVVLEVGVLDDHDVAGGRGECRCAARRPCPGCASCRITRRSTRLAQPALQQLAGAVGRAVVDDDDLLLGHGEARTRLEDPLDGGGLVVDGDDDRELHGRRARLDLAVVHLDQDSLHVACSRGAMPDDAPRGARRGPAGSSGCPRAARCPAGAARRGRCSRRPWRGPARRARRRRAGGRASRHGDRRAAPRSWASTT